MYAMRWLSFFPAIVSDSSNLCQGLTSFFCIIKTSRLRGPQPHRICLFLISSHTWVPHSYSGRVFVPQSFSPFRLSTTSRSITLDAQRLLLFSIIHHFLQKSKHFAIFWVYFPFSFTKCGYGTYFYPHNRRFYHPIHLDAVDG